MRAKRFCCFPSTKAWKASWQATVSPPSDEYQEIIPREELGTSEAITTNNHNLGENTSNLLKILHQCLDMPINLKAVGGHWFDARSFLAFFDTTHPLHAFARIWPTPLPPSCEHSKSMPSCVDSECAALHWCKCTKCAYGSPYLIENYAHGWNVVQKPLLVLGGARLVRAHKVFTQGEAGEKGQNLLHLQYTLRKHTSDCLQGQLMEKGAPIATHSFVCALQNTSDILHLSC